MRKRAWTAIVLAGIVVAATMWVVVTPPGPPRFLWTDGFCLSTSPAEIPDCEWFRCELDHPVGAKHDWCRARGSTQPNASRLMGSFTAFGQNKGPSRLDVVLRWLAALIPPANPPLRSGSLGGVTVVPNASRELEVARYSPDGATVAVLDPDGIAWVRCELVPDAK